MGFRPNAYATVWDIRPVSDTKTNIRIGINYRDKRTGEFKTDFEGFVSCVGSVAAKNAASLKKGDRIKLGDTDAVRIYNKETKSNFEDFKLFSFELVDSSKNGSSTASPIESEPETEEGEPDDRLPF